MSMTNNLFVTFFILIICIVSISEVNGSVSGNAQRYQEYGRKYAYTCDQEVTKERKHECELEQYYGLLFRIVKLIRSCTTELNRRNMGIKNIIHCVNLQRSGNTTCSKEDTECKGCKCLVLCVLQQLGLADGVGNVYEDTIFQLVRILEVKLPYFKNFRPHWDRCKTITGTDLCDRAYTTLSCCVEQDIDKATESLLTMTTDLMMSQSKCTTGAIKCRPYD